MDSTGRTFFVVDNYTYTIIDRMRKRRESYTVTDRGLVLYTGMMMVVHVHVLEDLSCSDVQCVSIMK